MRIDGFDNLHALPPSELKQRVAQEFESIFASMLLRSMRASTFGNELIPENFGEKMYTEMLDDEYARLLSAGSSLGLRDLIMKELGDSEGAPSPSPAALVQGLGSSRFGIDPRLSSKTTRGSVLENVKRWDALIDEAQRTYDIPRDLIASVIAQESAGNPYAVSRAGAKGLMQLMDMTARDLGVSRVFDPRQNIMGGTKYLRELLDRFKGDERLALASYNAGPAAVERYKGIPPYTETREYIERVLGYRHLFTLKVAGL